MALLIYALKVDHAWARDYGSNLGPYWQQVSAGVPRVVAGFTFGVLLARWGLWRDGRRSWTALLPVALLTGVMVKTPSRWLDLAAIAIVFPVCIAAACRVELPSWCEGICAFLGDVSYPLYAVHFPMIFAIRSACAALGIHGVRGIATFLVGSLALAWVLARLVRAIQAPSKASLKG